MALRIAAAAMALVGALALGSACNPNTDVEGSPCDRQGRCLDGYSCLVNTCVAAGSLAVGETCTFSEQCHGFPSYICGAEPFNCRKRCGGPYFASAPSACDTGQFCRAEADRDHPDQWTGTCFESECAVQEDCRDRTATAKACVVVSPSANACMQPCEVTVSGGIYSDTCGGASGMVYCQPIGPRDQQALVCLSRLDDNITGLPNPGDLCELAKVPCRPGAACVGEAQTFCRTYCDVGANNVSNENPDCPMSSPYCCTELSRGVPLYSVCQPDGC